MYDENKKEKPSLKEVEPSIFMDSDSRVKKLFICRAVLWTVALAATVYWIWWSFEIYNRGIFDPYEYAPMLRPVLTVCLLISLVALAISLCLRRKSDMIKKENAYKRTMAESLLPEESRKKK